MKVNQNIHLFLLIIVNLLASASCEKMMTFVKGGDEIAFSGDTEMTDVTTRLTYDSLIKNQKVPLYWSKGDIVRIVCPQAQDSIWADYVVSEIDNDNPTKAKIVLNSATTPVGLRWNDTISGYYYFLSAYPSPNMKGVCTSQSVKRSSNRSTISCNLAKSQNTLQNALSSNGGNYVLAPDMKWMLMSAYKKCKKSNFPSGDNVFLKYNPLTTAIQFTITNSVAKPLVIRQLILLSDTTQICGKFKVSSLSSSPVTINTNRSSRSVEKDSIKQVLLDFAEKEVTINQNKTFTFTFFLAPIYDVNDLWFKIVRGGEDNGASIKTHLGFTDGTGVIFPARKKSFVTGIMVPEGVQWTIDYQPVLTDWVDDGGEEVKMN